MNTDFVSFARKINFTSLVTGERIALEPTPTLLAYEEQRTGHDVVRKKRQTFVTTWEIARSLWFATTKSGVNVVTAILDDDGAYAPTLSSMLENAVRDRLIEPLVSHTSFPFRNASFRFQNGSEIRFLPVLSLRGKTHMQVIHRLHVAEAAYFPEETTNEVIASLLSCVPPSGEVVLESSTEDVEGREGLFAEIYRTSRLESGQWKAHELG